MKASLVHATTRSGKYTLFGNRWHKNHVIHSSVHKCFHILTTVTVCWLGHLRFFWISWAVWCRPLLDWLLVSQNSVTLRSSQGWSCTGWIFQPMLFSTSVSLLSDVCTVWPRVIWRGPAYLSPLFLVAVICALLPWVSWSSHLVSLLRLVSAQFIVTCPPAWNLLPPDLRTADQSRPSSFHKKLKTFLFNSYS